MNAIQHPFILQKIAGFGVDLIAPALGYGLAAFLMITWLAEAQLSRLRPRLLNSFHAGNTFKRRI